jgi:hypothetical protein
MDNDKATIPYIAHEGALARMERTTSRLFKVIVVLIIALFLSNALWLYAWMQYDYTSNDVTYAQDGEGYNNINAGIQGDVTNGADLQQENPDTDTQK